MELYGYTVLREEDLMHYGIKGQKWGVRRFQNEDMTWTSAGKERYGNGRSFGGTAHRALAKVYDINERYYSKHGNKTMASMNRAAKERQLTKAQESDQKKAEKKNDPVRQKKVERIKKAAKIGAVVAGTALAAYGGYKLNKVLNDNTSKHYRELSHKMLDKYAKHSLKADGYAKGWHHGINSGIQNTSESFERAMANENLAKYREYRSLANRGKYSAREKIDTAKRMARGLVKR